MIIVCVSFCLLWEVLGWASKSLPAQAAVFFWVDSMCQVDVFVFGMLHIYISVKMYIFMIYIYIYIYISLNIFIIYIYIHTSVCIHMYLWHETSLVARWILFFSTKLCYVLMCCAVCFSPDAISWCCFPSPCLFGISNVGTFAVDFRACPHGPVTHLGTWLQLTI